MRPPYSREHEAELRSAVQAGRQPRCPACDVPMDVHEVAPRDDVAYVRSRRWLRCGSCHRSLVVEAARGRAR